MICWLILLALTLPCWAEKWALCAPRVIDGRGSEVLLESAVLVEGSRIQGVVPRSRIPAGYQSREFPDCTLLPGLIDAHVHLLIDADDYQVDHLRKSSAANSLRAVVAARRLLEHGWTTVRVAGDADVHYAHLEAGKAIARGDFQGARIVGAGHYLSITGGGGDINFLGPEHQVVADGLVVDGVDEVRKAVRREAKYGSGWIKLLVTGAFMSAGDDPRQVHFSTEELSTAVSEASRLGLPVMAHAHSAEGIIQAVRAGVRSIEHGTFINDEGIELMVARGTYLVPTLTIGEYYLKKYADSQAQAKMVELTRRYRSLNHRGISKAIAAGVKVCVGTDLGAYPEVDEHVREFELLHQLGMTPMQAIWAGTRVNAEMMGLKDLGTLEAGKTADIIAVQGDPVEDLGALRKVVFVMKAGRQARLSDTFHDSSIK